MKENKISLLPVTNIRVEQSAASWLPLYVMINNDAPDGKELVAAVKSTIESGQMAMRILSLLKEHYEKAVK